MPELVLPHLGWKCRPYQREVWKYLEAGGKRAICLWHRRAGKDEVALHWTAVSAVRKPAVYWHMLPQAEQARKAVWDAVNPHTGRRRIDEVWPSELIESKREDIMQLKLKNNAVWQVVGSDNYNSLVGSPPYGVVFSEYAVADPAAWDYIRPILAENGGWAIWPYTPRGQNHGYDLYEAGRKNKNWFVQRLTIEDTKALSQDVIEEERLAGMDEDLIRQEYYCSFTAPNSGSYYGRQMSEADEEGRIGNVPHERSAVTLTSWDLGIGDSTAIWLAQVVGMEIHLIDYHQASGQPIEHYVDWLEDRAKQFGYRYHEHYLPHDADARERGSGRSIIETLESMRLAGELRLLPRHRIDDGINAVRVILPRCWFDEEKCALGIKALRAYRRAYDDKAKAFSNRPLHDWSSDPADSFRYLCMGISPSSLRERQKPVRYARHTRLIRGGTWAG